MKRFCRHLERGELYILLRDIKLSLSINKSDIYLLQPRDKKSLAWSEVCTSVVFQAISFVHHLPPVSYVRKG